MARGVAKLGAVAGAGLLAVLMAAGTASAAPDGTPAVSDAGAKVPAPQTGLPAPGPKLEGGGQTAARALPMHLDGVCNFYLNGTGDICYWYFAGYGGSHVDYFYGDTSHWNNVFNSAGSGQGAVVANNFESVYNYDTLWTAWLCTSTNYNGSCGYVLPRHGGNLNATWFNNTESLYWTR
jgi:hypothetical protein